MVYYFAYGSNMDENRINNRVGFYKIIGTGVLKNYTLVFNKISKDNPSKGYANIIPKDNCLVEGIIYEINSDGIKKLDKKEGFPSHYERKKMKILHDSEYIICEVYIANKNMVNNNLKPTRDYLAHILEGKNYFSKEYLDKLKTTVTLD